MAAEFKSAEINLWSLMVSSKGKDFAGADKAAEVVGLAGAAGGFCSEINLTVDSNGTWRISLTCHDDIDNSIELTVLRSGNLSVERTRSVHDVREQRRVSF